MPQSSGLRPVLYLYTADLPVALNSTIATYADDIAVLAVHNHSNRSIFAIIRKSLSHLEMV